MSEAKSAREPDVYHGQDKAAAIKRARLIEGMVVKSTAPDSGAVTAGETGYWSGPVGMVRTWETLINFSRGAAR